MYIYICIILRQMGMYESRPCRPFVHTTTNGKWMFTPKKKRIGKMVFDTSRNNVSFHTSVLDPGALKALRGTSPNDRKSKRFFSASKPMMPYSCGKSKRPHLEWFFSKTAPLICGVLHGFRPLRQDCHPFMCQSCA